MVQSGEMQLFSDTIGALLEHKDILKDIDTSLLKDQLNYIPEDLRIEFGSSLKELEGMLQFETLQNFDLRDAEEKI